MKNAGSLPMKNEREIDRAGVAVFYGWTHEEIDRAAFAFKAAHHRQPLSRMTFREYLDLMRDSGLRPSQVGKRTGEYQLARYGDAGAYDIGNCRFVPGVVNQMERRKCSVPPEARRRLSEAALRRPRLQCSGCGGAFSPGMFSRWHGAKCKA
jgi:hypothetical protein